MAGTFSQIYIQYVFAVKGRQNLLQRHWREELFKYIAGIVKGKGQKPIIVNGVEDHVHVSVGLRPSMSFSDLIRDIKIIHPILLMNKDGYRVNSLGRKDMEYFRMHIHKSKIYISILPIRKYITEEERFEKNILNFFKNLKLHTTKNTCLNGWIEISPPWGFCKYLNPFYSIIIPSGFLMITLRFTMELMLIHYL